jgi:hypothetical protein
MLQPLFDIVRPYWPTLVAVLLGFVVFPLATAALNWALWWDTPAAWDAYAAKHPERALWIRRLRAVSPHLRKLVVLSRDAAAARTSLPARGVIDALSPRVAVLAEKAGAVAVSDTRGAFDASARQAIAPDVVAVAQRITRESERGYATLRALLAAVVLLAVVVAALGIGCGPRVLREPTPATPPDGCVGGATVCHDGAPWRCSRGRWSQADRVCARLGTDASPPPVCCLTQSALREDAVLHACVPTAACLPEAEVSR